MPTSSSGWPACAQNWRAGKRIPVPQPMRMRKPMRSEVVVSGERRVNRPQEMMVMTQPIQTVHRKRRVTVMITPATAAEGAVVRVMGRASTPA